MTTMIRIGSQEIAADGLTLPDRQFREAWMISGDAVVIDETKLPQIKARYSGMIDADAEKVRMKYMTPGVGMAMTYQEKFAQATAVQAMGQIAANELTKDQRDAQFPTLSASVGIEAATLWDCCLLVIGRYAAFATLSHAIERIRLQAKKDIAAATTIDAARAIYGSIAWAP